MIKPRVNHKLCKIQGRLQLIIYLLYSEQLRHHAIRSEFKMTVYFDGIKVEQLIEGIKTQIELPRVEGELQVGFARTEAGRILPYPFDYDNKVEICAWKSVPFKLECQHENKTFLTGARPSMWFFDFIDLVPSDSCLFIKEIK